MKSKSPPPLFSIFPGHRTDRVTNSLCTLLGDGEGAIYREREIRVAMVTDNTTMPIAYEDHSSNGLVEVMHAYFYYDQAPLSVA
jgi:hypothetical protein